MQLSWFARVIQSWKQDVWLKSVCNVNKNKFSKTETQLAFVIGTCDTNKTK